MVLFGDLENGVYDECSDLTEEEINTFYGFNSNGDTLEHATKDVDSSSEPEISESSEADEDTAKISSQDEAQDVIDEDNHFNIDVRMSLNAESIF